MNKIVRGVILDLDGTVYRGEKLLPGARQSIHWLQEHSFPLVFISNKPLESRIDYASKLTGLGIPTQPDDVIHSSLALVNYLKDKFPDSVIFAIGEDPLLDELQASFQLSEDIDEIDIVVASFDRTFNYHKLNVGFQAIKQGAKFFATNADVTCPVANGEIPDAGAVIAALEACCGKKVELVAGKPSSLIIEMALKKIGLPASSCIVIGDRLETDILMGQKAGTVTALVLTGVTREADHDTYHPKPDYVLQSLADLPALLSV